MKKAYNSLKNQDEWTIIDSHVVKALNISGKDDKSAVMSILGKRLLIKSKIAPGMSNPDFEKRKEELRTAIGDDAYRRLELHDEILKDYASDWK